MCLLLVSTLRQDLLYSLLFLQQERSDDSLTHTRVTSGSPVGSANLSLTLGSVTVCRRLEVLDSRKTSFAVHADGSLGLLDDAL